MNGTLYHDFIIGHGCLSDDTPSSCKPALFAVRLPGSRPAYHVTVYPANVYGKTYAAKTLCGIRIFRTAQAVTGEAIAAGDKTEPCRQCAKFVLNSRPADYPAAFAREDDQAS